MLNNPSITEQKDFTFRLRFKLAPTCGLDIDELSKELNIESFPKSLVLKPRLEPERTIRSVKELVLKSSGWISEENAKQFGNKLLDALLRTMAKVRVGIDFEDRKAMSTLTKEGIMYLENMYSHRILDCHPGLMVFETNPIPRHVAVDSRVEIFPDSDIFFRVLNAAINSKKVLTDSERLALHLFHSSFFQTSADSRFLMLIMAIESCIIQFPRSQNEIEYLEKIIKMTECETSLSDLQKEALIAGISSLKSVSISKAGKTLVSEKLKNKKYNEKSAERFFTECYSLRSRLVHARKTSSQKGYPTFEEINSYVAELEVMVSDLLSDDLLEQDVE